MFYHGYMRRGGCSTCGGGGNRNFRNVHSPSFYNNRYTSTFKNNYDLEKFESSFSPYNNNRQRIMTPPRNISNYNFNVEDNYNNLNRNNYQNYNSPQRNTGCKSCSMGSNNVLRRNDYQRPTTGYPMRRTNNIYTLNSMNFQNDNDNYKYNFRKRYDNDYDDINDDVHEFNRYNSPLRSPQRNLQNSFSSENIYNNRMNTNNYSYNNNNNTNPFNGIKNLKRINNNNIRTVLNNNKYRSFFKDNFNRYDNDDNENDYDNNNYNNRFDNNYFREENRNYYYMKNKNMKNFNNNRNDYYSNSRYNYLMSNEDSKNDYNDDRFITLNIFNYPRKIRDMIQQRKTFFVYLYGSHDYTGQSWCSDCNIARPNVEEAKNIIKNRRYDKELYFINIPIEKIYMDDFKDDPIIQLERVPTLIYYENGLERGRLIENDLFSYQSIRDFILQAYNDYNDNIDYNRYNMTKSQYLYKPRIYY